VTAGGARRLLVAAVLAAGAATLQGCTPAHALETFDLGERDKVLYEAQGCFADCTVLSPQRRSCAVKGFDCKVVCQSIPECRPEGGSPVNVCVVVKR
jgi:hypothetical protein